MDNTSSNDARKRGGRTPAPRPEWNVCPACGQSIPKGAAKLWPTPYGHRCPHGEPCHAHGEPSGDPCRACNPDLTVEVHS